uniref:B30.2/SPRY domain-containing protein n=1 Tax=Meloidogyne hapla TaxID=6305 RepID=A0A1I8BCF0_MELHA
MKGSTDEKNGELSLELGQTKNLCFVYVANKWKEFDFSKYSIYKCCEKECINTENPIGKCIRGNGFANIINDEEIEYIEWFKVRGHFGGHDNSSHILAENSFNKPKEDFNNYSLFYFEIKCKFEEEINNNTRVGIGLKNSEDNYISLSIWLKYTFISYKFQGKGSENSIKKIVWNNNDIFGCGLVYPPTNNKKLPYIFFTQNGQQIGKTILNDNFEDYKPYIGVTCCSLETNFGKDLEAKPFVYDITKHTQYSDFENDLNELIEIFTSIKKEGIKRILLENGIDKENVLKKLIEIFPKNY